MTNKRIHIMAQPNHWVKGVKCPYCKQKTLGVLKEPLDETRSQYIFSVV